ncbi:dual specificity protein phosphatase PHS1 isoform X2 [Tanacetum coccineum]
MTSSESKEDLYALSLQKEEEDKFDCGPDDTDAPVPLTVASRVLYMLSDIAAGPAFRFTQWLELVRKRSGKYKSSGFPHRRLDRDLSLASKTYPPFEQVGEISLWERLGKAAMLNIESSSFSWDMLSSLHHTEHSSSNEHPEDDTKALEVTVNSGGVVFFALFKHKGSGEFLPKEAAAVIKIASSRMATQSERLGCEFAKWLGVRSPQARVIHNCSPEWLKIKEAAEKAREVAVSEADEVGEVTCSELLEALELSRCLYLMNPEYASNLLHEITTGKLGVPPEAIETSSNLSFIKDMNLVVHEFRSGFRAALMDLQGFHIFLLTLHQKLDSLLKGFMNIIDKTSSGDFDREDLMVLEAQSHSAPCVSPQGKESDSNDTELQKTAPKASSSGCKENLDPVSPMSRDSSHGKSHKGSATTRMTSRLRDFHKYAKVDAELNKELEQWNELLKNEAVKLCQENNFNSGFFEGNESNAVVDAHELKLRLEHILERISLISDAGNTEKPSSVTSFLFIGGALAARSVYTLQHIGITHILCLCSNEIGQSDSQRRDFFEYQNFSICDEEDSNISEIFEEANQFIDAVEQKGGKVLVHCFEGRSRSATVVLAYLMMRKNFTLQKAWNTLRRVHRRAQPNDGFATVLLELDRKLHGNVSMEWQQKKPSMKVCPVCGKNAGLSSSSLKLHLQKAHKKLSSGSVDSAMTMEIQKFSGALKHFHQDKSQQRIEARLIVVSQGKDNGNAKECNVISYIEHMLLAWLEIYLNYGYFVSLSRNFTLQKAWNTLRRVHRRAQPNDGFATVLLELDRKLHGNVSMEWQQKKPSMKVCPVCGKNAGLSSSSLKLHLQKAHKKLSSGSVDSAMTMEIQKVLEALNISPRQSHTMD